MTKQEILESAQCPYWVHNAAHTNNTEALRKIALWYADWNSSIRCKELEKMGVK